MQITAYSHRNGSDVIPQEYTDELGRILHRCKVEMKKYSIADFKNYLLPAIKRGGWSDEFYLDRNSKITISSIKGKTGLCIQTGNAARLYADLLKLQTLYARGTITAGIIILPVGTCARSLGTNLASYERAVRELDIFKQVITTPLVVIGFDN